MTVTDSILVSMSAPSHSFGGDEDDTIRTIGNLPRRSAVTVKNQWMTIHNRRPCMRSDSWSFLIRKRGGMVGNIELHSRTTLSGYELVVACKQVGYRAV